MHKQTRQTAISASVKAAWPPGTAPTAPATCILCGAPGGPHCHVVRRSQGGMGVVENIVTLCGPCHYAFDEGLFMDRLRPLGFHSQADIRAYIINYLRGFYPDWTEEKVRYHKWDSVSESSST